MMGWNNSVYIDLCFPFGLCSVPKLFNVAVGLLQWIVEHNSVTPLLHYTFSYPQSPLNQIPTITIWEL